jgi:hypothetical protein
MANPALFVAGSPDQGTTKAIIKTDATGKLLTVGENADVVAALTTLKNTVATESSLQSLVSASEPVTSVLNTTHFAEQQAAIDSTAIDITPYENIFVEVSGTLAGANVTLKGSLDGDSFWSLMMTPCTSSELSKTSMDTQGIFSTNIAGLSHVQACLMGSTAETLVTVKSMATTLARAGASQVNVSDRASRKLGEVTLSGSTEVTFPAAQPVQLSGQVVTEQKLTENLEIAAGAEVRIGSNSGFPAQCNALSFGVLCDADAEIGITLWPVTFGAPASTYPTVLLDGSITTSNLRAVSPLWTPVSTRVSPRVRNNSGVPVTVSVVMYRWFNTQQ